MVRIVFFFLCNYCISSDSKNVFRLFCLKVDNKKKKMWEIDLFWGHSLPTFMYRSMSVLHVHFMCFLFVCFVSSLFCFLAFLAFRNFQVPKEPHLYKKIFLEHCCQPWFEAGVYKIFTEPILMRFPALIKRVWLLHWNDLPKLS